MRESLRRQGKTCASTNTRLDTSLDIQIGGRKRQGKMESEQRKRIKQAADGQMRDERWLSSGRDEAVMK